MRQVHELTQFHAAAIINLLTGQPVYPEQVLSNTGYSYVCDRRVAHGYFFKSPGGLIMPLMGS